MRIFSPAIAASCPLRLVPLWSSANSLPRCRRESGRRRSVRARSSPGIEGLLLDLGNATSSDGPTAFTDREPQALFHSDRLDQLHLHLGVVTRKDHVGALRQV